MQGGHDSLPMWGFNPVHKVIKVYVTFRTHSQCRYSVLVALLGMQSNTIGCVFALFYCGFFESCLPLKHKKKSTPKYCSPLANTEIYHICSTNDNFMHRLTNACLHFVEQAWRDGGFQSIFIY